MLKTNELKQKVDIARRASGEGIQVGGPDLYYGENRAYAVNQPY